MSIIVNDNIQVNSGKALDNKYLKNGIVPYVDIADVNTTIPLSYRSPYLTVVIGTQEYWYFNGVNDIDLVVKSSAIQTDITVSNLQTLISSSLLVVGVKYAITNFQDRNLTDTNSRVIVTATSSNTISQSGFWKRLTTNKAYGAFALNSGTAGSVDQVTVGATTLMTASIPYTISRINTANLIAVNINANSVVSGYSAIVIAGETVIDRPAIIIERVTSGVDTSTLLVSVTTLTVTNLVNLTMGVAESEQVLDISYDITVDRITSCYDNVYDIRMTYTSQRITSLGYNPIVNWRWGHSTFRNWTFYNVAYRNYFDFPSTSGANTIEQNNNLIDGSFDGVVMRRTSPITTSFSNNTANINFTNVQLLAICQINSNNIYLLFNNVTVSNTLNIFHNTGNYGKNLATTSALGRLFLNGFSCVGVSSINTNCILSGQVSLGARFQSTVNFTSNTVSGTIGNASAADNYLQSFTVSGNNISGSVTFPSGGDRDFVILITNNLISSSTLNLQFFNINVIGKTATISSCSFDKAVVIFNETATDSVTLNESYFYTGGNFLTLKPTVICNINNSIVSLKSNNNGTIIIGSLIITDSTLELYTLQGGSLWLSSSLTITGNSKVTDLRFLTPSDSCTINNSIVSDLAINLAQNSILNIDNSSLEKIAISQISTGTANVSVTSCSIKNTPITVSFGTFTMTNSRFNNSTLKITEVSLLDGLTVLIDKCNGDDVRIGDFIDMNFGTAQTLTLSQCNFKNSDIQPSSVDDGQSCTIEKSNFTNCTFLTSIPIGGNNFFSNFSLSNYDLFLSNMEIQDYFISISNMTIDSGRGKYRRSFTFDGTANKGLSGSVIPIFEMFTQNTGFTTPLGNSKAIITDVFISLYDVLTFGAGIPEISIGYTTNTEYLPATLATPINTNLQIKNNPIGQYNLSGSGKYNINALPTGADITGGSVDFEIEFKMVK